MKCSDPDRLGPQICEVRVTVRYEPVCLVEQSLREADHAVRRLIAQVCRVEIPDADAVECISVLEQRRQPPVWMAAVELFRDAVMDDGGVDDRVVVVCDSAACEQ